MKILGEKQHLISNTWGSFFFFFFFPALCWNFLLFIIYLIYFFFGFVSLTFLPLTFCF